MELRKRESHRAIKFIFERGNAIGFACLATEIDKLGHHIITRPTKLDLSISGLCVGRDIDGVDTESPLHRDALISPEK